MRRFKAEVHKYLNDRNLTFDSEEVGFPSRTRLTGEFYLGRESFWTDQGQQRVSLMARCLERPLANTKDRDYLGLEVTFELGPRGRISLIGVDSSSI